jgi:hypothetical protein
VTAVEMAQRHMVRAALALDAMTSTAAATASSAAAAAAAFAGGAVPAVGARSPPPPPLHPGDRSAHLPSPGHSNSAIAASGVGAGLISTRYRSADHSRTFASSGVPNAVPRVAKRTRPSAWARWLLFDGPSLDDIVASSRSYERCVGLAPSALTAAGATEEGPLPQRLPKTAARRRARTADPPASGAADTSAALPPRVAGPAVAAAVTGDADFWSTVPMQNAAVGGGLLPTAAVPPVPPAVPPAAQHQRRGGAATGGAQSAAAAAPGCISRAAMRNMLTESGVKFYEGGQFAGL